MSQLNIENLPTTLQTVQSRPLFVMRLDVKKPFVFGETPQGTRRISGISGGVFHGERLNGKILDGGNDWQIIRKDIGSFGAGQMVRGDRQGCSQ
jgi:hypothetical protein